MVTDDFQNTSTINNSPIQTNPWILLCSVAAVIGTMRYWKMW